MHHRRTHGAKIALFALLVQTFLSAIPAGSITAFAANVDDGITKTGTQLPSAAERLGGSDRLDEATYTAPKKEEEPGELQEDGSFMLPAAYVENADAKAERKAEKSAYKAERKAGGIGIMRMNVSGDVTTNTTWTLANSPYVVSGTINVQSPAVLTIEPGVIVKFESGASLLVQAGATLTANGTSTSPITFTSYKDDSAGGDDNGDGAATSPAPGDWAVLGYSGYADISGGHAALGSMTFATVRYGQQFQARFSKPALADDTISKMSLYGFNLDTPPGTTYTIERMWLSENAYNLYLWAVPSTTTIQNSTFRNATGSVAAIQASSNTAVRLTSNAIERNATPWAIQSASSPMVLRYNAIAFNRRTDGTAMGITASGSTVDAQYNWWGSVTGPAVSGQADTGGGSLISATLVTYTNWLGTAFQADHKRGNFPWSAKAGVGSDVASGNFFYQDADVSIPTIGFPLEVRRAYNNQAATVAGGDFGAGWTWTFGTNLNTAADANGGVTWEQADGAKDYFKKNADNTFTGEDGIFSRLVYDPATSQYTLTHKDQTKFVFNATGKLIKQIDTDGNETVIARDGTGKIQTVTEPTGRQLTVTYNAGGQISRIVDPLGRTFDYTYNAVAPIALTSVTRKVSTSGATYASCSYVYTSFVYQLTTVNDCDGNKLVLTYDASKRVLTQVWNQNAQVRFTYGPATDGPSGLTFAAGSTGVFDERGRAHVYFYTKGNKVFEKWREKQILGGVYYWYTEHLWTYIGYLASSYRDIESKTTTTTYDWQAANLLEEIRPGSRKTTNTYDAFNNRTSAKDNLNRITSFEYDGEQHLTKVTDPLTHETTMTYTTAGLPATVTDARGKVTSFTYDAWGYPETVTNPEAETLTFDYDAGGRKLYEETPASKRTSYTYDSRDHVLTVTDPLLNVTTTTYDAKGRKATVQDAEGRVTTYTYNDLKNLLWKTTDAKSGVVEFTYDTLGPNLISVKDALLHVTAFQYDDFNRKTQETDALSKLTKWEYTYGGKLAKTTDALNGTATYTYATNNDLSSIAYSDSKSISYTYDGVGNRLTMTDWVGTHTWVYDDLNRVTSATDGSGNTIAYGYDEVGNLTTITYPGSKTVTYTFDDAKRMATVTDWDGRVTSYAFDAAGRIGSFTLPNGVVTTYGYDDASRTTHVDHTKTGITIAERDYTFDDVGDRVTSDLGAASDTYVYDELYRITGITYADGATQSFSYDAAGNRTAQTAHGLTTAYTYDAVDQLTNAGDGIRTHDFNGQLTKIGAHRGFTWDVRGKLTEITDSPSNTAPTANAGANKTVYVNRLAVLAGSGTDPEGEPLTYAWTEGGSNPATGLLHGTTSPNPGFTPTITGTYAFTLTVSDGRATSAGSTVTYTVLSGTPPNQTLTAVSAAADSGFVNNAQPTTRFFTNSLRTGKSSTTNEYRGAAQFALPATPAGTTLSAASLQLMGSSNVSNTAGDSWTVDLLPTSTDANWTSTSWNAIGTVTPDATLAPSLDGLNQVVANSADIWTFGSGDLAVLASRIAGSSKLSIRTKGNGSSSLSQVYWRGGNATTPADRPTLTLTYSPNAEYDHAPIARAGGAQTAVKSTLVTLNGAGSFDYEDTAVTYVWTQAAGPTVTLSSATVASPTFTPTEVGTYRFALTVSDSAAHTSAVDEIVVRVLAELPPAATSYAYDGDGDRISQTADSVVTDYVVNSVPKLAEVLIETTGGTAIYFVYGQDLLYSVVGTTPHYHHTDALGSTIAVTDSAGEVEQAMDYDVFGQLRSITGANGTRRTFTGEENDSSAFIYLRARYYDPAVGRFLSRDSYPADALDTQTINRYVYVKNNPTNYVDPSGEVFVHPLLMVYSVVNRAVTRTWDAKTDSRINTLQPALRIPARLTINLTQLATGQTFRIAQATRTDEQQNALYAQGRNGDSRPVVTNARAGESYHNFGRAFDVVEIKNGEAIWNSNMSVIVPTAKALGFEWGGDWSRFPDYPHFQRTDGYSLSELNRNPYIR